MRGVRIIKLRDGEVIAQAWIVPEDDEDWIYPEADGWLRVYSHPQHDAARAIVPFTEDTRSLIQRCLDGLNGASA